MTRSNTKLYEFGVVSRKKHEKYYACLCKFMFSYATGNNIKYKRGKCLVYRKVESCHTKRGRFTLTIKVCIRTENCGALEFALRWPEVGARVINIIKVEA